MPDGLAHGVFGLCSWDCNVRPPKIEGQVMMTLSFIKPYTAGFYHPGTGEMSSLKVKIEVSQCSSQNAKRTRTGFRRSGLYGFISLSTTLVSGRFKPNTHA